ncbi:hypothetical protein B0H16DRAFT_1715613 [Mycena metata]|uniref:Fucose-specific lectin n=1 Tax=Mycena metata TaxID=1033252 RepID=A0AAD7JTI4_9AGAR|nr:hypothetical protein B0H16DRAFT_1715613 [Mycena metata]
MFIFKIAMLFGGVFGRVIPRGVGPSPDSIPESFVGNIAAIQATNDLTGDTRIYFQNADNSIEEIGVTGPFTSGRLFGQGLHVPADEVQGNTLIAAVTIDGEHFQEIHLFFVSPANILSEYIFDTATGWRGGASCTDCITVNAYAVEPGNRVLYAMGNSASGSPAILRVGFVSAGAPTTLSEADYDPVNGWRLAQLN